MIQPILIQATQGPVADTTNTSKSAGARSNDFAAALKTAEQASSGAAPAALQVEAPAANKPANDADTTPVLFQAVEETSDAQKQGETEPAGREDLERAPAIEPESTLENIAAWLPAALTGMAQSAPLPAPPAEPQTEQPKAIMDAAAPQAALPQAASALPVGPVDPGAIQAAEGLDVEAQPAAVQTAGQPVMSTPSGATETQTAQPAVSQTVVQATAQTTVQIADLPKAGQQAASIPSGALDAQPVEPAAFQTAVPMEATNGAQPELVAQQASAAVVAGVSLTASADTASATPSLETLQNVQPETTQPGVEKTPAQATPANAAAPDTAAVRAGTANAVPANADAVSGEIAQAASQQPADRAAQKASNTETSRAAATKVSVTSQSATTATVEAILRSDLNTNVGPAQSSATLQSAPNTAALASDPTLLRQAIIDQTRQGIETGLQNGQTSLRLRLTPENLGAIDLRVIAGPQGASVLIRAENPATGRLLEQNLSDLRMALQDAGVQLNNVSIGQQAAQNEQFSGKNAFSQHELPNAFQRNAAHRNAAANAEDVESVAARRNGATTLVNYLV